MMRSGTELMIIDLKLNVNPSTGTSSEPQSNSSEYLFDQLRVEDKDPSTGL